MKRLLALVFLAVALAAGPAAAVNPDEVLPDPALEARARDISSELRCMVCQNQSIDDSDAELARDLRIVVRQRLVAGDSDRQVMDYVVSRYGEFVLLRPPLNWRNALLWLTPVLLLAAGLAFVIGAARRRPAAVQASLSSAEEAELRRVLGDGRD
jgi:cytochrome c-type biogenesis protein CcmH